MYLYVCVYSWPTCVYEPSWCAFAELFGLVRQSDLDDPGDVSGRRLDPDGMRCDQLQKEGKVRKVRGPRVITFCNRTMQVVFSQLQNHCNH